MKRTFVMCGAYPVNQSLVWRSAAQAGWHKAWWANDDGDDWPLHFCLLCKGKQESGEFTAPDYEAAVAKANEGNVSMPGCAE